MFFPVVLFLGQLLPPMPPNSVWETPAMKEARSLAESTARAPKDFLTLAESSQYTKTGTYAECLAFYQRLAKSSPYGKLITIGKSAAGHDLYVFVASKDKAFTPEAATKTNKPILLLQNGIHAGENGGKDAAMMLLRDVLVTKQHQAWLDQVIILSIPVFNVDGHENVSPYHRINENGPMEMGFRSNSVRQNLNRDYLKADTPEMRAWLGVFTSWLPDFLIDNHVTDGSDHQYDVTYAIHTQQDLASAPRQWVNTKYYQQMLSGMEKDGHVLGWYIGGPGNRPGALSVMTASPRYSTGYATAQNRPSLLVETHSLKTFKVRTWAHYDIMRHTLNLMAADPAGLKQATRAADAEAAGLKPGTKVFLEGVPTGPGEDYVMRQLETTRYQGAAAGGPILKYEPKPLNRSVKVVVALAPKVEPEAPAGYLIPRGYAALGEVLRAHQVRFEVTTKPVTGEFETYRFENVSFPPQPFEGRFQPNFAARLVKEKRTLPAGSLWVPTNQRAVRVLMQLLEPAATDSFAKWGFLNSVFEQKEYFSDYIFEPIAEEMLRRDPKLKAEFEEKLKEASFAGNPRARLAWLHQRSPYLEPDKNAYPIVRVAAKSW